MSKTSRNEVTGSLTKCASWYQRLPPPLPLTNTLKTLRNFGPVHVRTLVSTLEELRTNNKMPVSQIILGGGGGLTIMCAHIHTMWMPSVREGRWKNKTLVPFKVLEWTVSSFGPSVRHVSPSPLCRGFITLKTRKAVLYIQQRLSHIHV